MVITVRFAKYFVLLALALFMAGCGLQQVQPKTTPQPTTSVPTPIPSPTLAVSPAGAKYAAVVNGVAIPMKVFKDLAGYFLNRAGQSGQQVTPKIAAQQTIGELIQDAVVRQEAAKNGVTVTPKAVNKQVQAALTQLGGATGLKSVGLTKADLVYLVTPGLLQQKLTKAKFPVPTRGPVASAQHILIIGKEPAPSQPVARLFESVSTPTKDKCSGKILTDSEAHAEAKRFLKELNSGTTSFARLAKRCSDDTGSATNGGKLTGTYGPKLYPETSSFVRPFENAIFSRSTVVGKPRLVRSQFGWHIVEVTNRHDTKYTKAIGSAVQQGKFSAWIEGIAENAHAKIIEKVK